MAQSFQITRVAQLESLEVFHWFITECCSKYNIPESILMDLKLAVDEACTDIIENNNEKAKSGSICLSFRVESNQIIIQITDSGYDNELIDINRPDSATLENLGSRVTGSYMIEQTMDNIDYQSSENGNILTITKIIK